MNDQRAVELLDLARKANVCKRISPYQERMDQGVLQMSDIVPDDALWLLGVVKVPVHRALLKQIAKGHPGMSLVEG